MLSIASHLVGQLIAIQDQRVVTKEIALRIVEENIEQGNHEAILALGETKGNG